MQKYRVILTRVKRESVELLVEAESSAEADWKAIQEANQQGDGLPWERIGADYGIPNIDLWGHAQPENG